MKDFCQGSDIILWFLFVCFVLMTPGALLGMDCSGPEGRDTGRMLPSKERKVPFGARVVVEELNL